MPHTQLPLNVFLNQQFTFGNFAGQTNRVLLQALQNAVYGESAPSPFYLWGAKRSGKTHLLQAVCNAYGEVQKHAMYVPLAEHAAFDVEVISQLSSMHAVCFDDVDSIAGNAQWEHALFHCFNALREARVSMVYSASSPPRQSAITLPDLVTRLSWGLVYKLEALDDAEKLQWLIDRAAEKGLQMPQNVAAFILSHAPRDVGALCEILNILDNASMASQRRLTIPFVKQYIG